MEDMWKDITAHSSFNPPLTPITNTSITTAPHHGTILRDFLSSGDPGSPAPARSLNLNTYNGASSPSTARLPCFGITATASSSLMESLMKKRIISDDKETSGDRKYKRMMKNRESAARSRERRTAYTFELEKAKNQLMEENEKLKKILQGQQLFSAAVIEDKEAPKKRNRIRSLSALF